MNSKLYSKLLTYNFEKLFKEKGYAYFTDGLYNLNIIGVRSEGNEVTNKFDDFIVVIYNSGKSFKRIVLPATTDPGLTYVKTPMSDEGAAILVPGQYRGAYKIGLHRKKYLALVQCKKVKVYRDRNKDDIYDYRPDTIQIGHFGINIHKAGTLSTRVNNWSAGCQVIASNKDFQSLMYLCHKQVEYGKGDTFTYTLVKEEDLV